MRFTQNHKYKHCDARRLVSLPKPLILWGGFISLSNFKTIHSVVWGKVVTLQSNWHATNKKSHLPKKQQINKSLYKSLPLEKTVWLSWLLIVDAESICSAILCPESPAIHQKGNCVWRCALVCPRHHRITESPSLFSALSALGPESLLTSSTNCFEVNSPQFMNLHKLFLQPRSIQLIFMEPWEIPFLRKKLGKLAFNRWCQNLACGTSTWTMNKRLNLWVGNTFVFCYH